MTSRTIPRGTPADRPRASDRSTVFSCRQGVSLLADTPDHPRRRLGSRVDRDRRIGGRLPRPLHERGDLVRGRRGQDIRKGTATPGAEYHAQPGHRPGVSRDRRCILPPETEIRTAAIRRIESDNCWYAEVPAPHPLHQRPKDGQASRSRSETISPFPGFRFTGVGRWPVLATRGESGTSHSAQPAAGNAQAPATRGQRRRRTRIATPAAIAARPHPAGSGTATRSADAAGWL